MGAGTEAGERQPLLLGRDAPRAALGFGHLPGAAPTQELVPLLTQVLAAPCWKVAALPSLCGRARSSNVGELLGYHGDESPEKSYP